MERTNETWVAQLRASGAEQEAALADLRAALLGGLRRALAGHPHAGAALLEDVVQEALLRILDRLHQFAGLSRFVTWATAIAIRLAMSELRRRRFQDVSLDDLVAAAGEPASGDGGGPALHPERQALLANLREQIRRLTERQRKALVAELRGMPQDEIARHLGSNRNALYKLTHDARKRLRQGLEAAGYHAEHVRAAFDEQGATSWP